MPPACPTRSTTRPRATSSTAGGPADRGLPADYYGCTRRRSTRTTTSGSRTATGCCSSTRRVDGVKTGHTDAAGYCLIASAAASSRAPASSDGCCRSCIGTASESARAIESQKLLNYGFQNFDAVKRAGGRPADRQATRSGRARRTRSPAGFVAGRVRHASPRARRARSRPRSSACSRWSRRSPGSADRHAAREARRPGAAPNGRCWRWRRSTGGHASAVPGIRSACGSRSDPAAPDRCVRGTLPKDAT